MFADLALSRRLEGAEGFACRQFAEARRRMFPESGAVWMRCAGTWAVFDTVDSPSTQTFGLGVFEELTADALGTIERFFLDRGAPVAHEVSPFAGVAALDLLCARNYRPVEISSVLYRTVERLAAVRTGVRARPESLFSGRSGRATGRGRRSLHPRRSSVVRRSLYGAGTASAGIAGRAARRTHALCIRPWLRSGHDGG